MTAINNVFGSVFQYHAVLDLDVYGNVREWEAVVVTENPASGWTVKTHERLWDTGTQERVWKPNSGLVIFNVQRKTS